MDPRSFAVQERLRNGTPVTIRAIRPDDRSRLREAYERLTPEAVYLRTFSYKKALTETELARLTDVDFDRHVALVVTTGSEMRDTIIGGGRYVRTDGASSGRAAEVAFTVDARYQGQGIASRLLSHLAAIARERGIDRFDADVLTENRPMVAVFARSGLPMERRHDGGVLHVALAL